jgi:hypothetical protein
MHALGQGAESPTNSVVLSSRDHAGRSRSYARSHEHNGLYSLANRKAPRLIHVHPHSGAVVDYTMGPASFLKFTSQSQLHRGR